jgi:hypothetical protein
LNDKLQKNIDWKFCFVWVILFTVMCSSGILAQQLTQLEQNLDAVQKQLSREIEILDSLKTTYEIEIEKIEYEKNKSAPDKDKITGMMASAILLSNKIESRQSKIDSIELRIKSLKKILDSKYTQIIDSLKTLEASEDFDGDTDLLNLKILSFIEKKILMGLKVLTLSYTPEKLLDISFIVSDDSLSRIMQKDYLISAITEVDSEQIAVSEFKNELKQVVRLRNKVDKFISDTEFETDLISFNFPSSRNERTTYAGVSDFNQNEKILLSNLASYTFILDKLILQQSIDLKKNSEWQLKFKPENTDVSLQDFIDLLNEVESRLSIYRSMLKNTLSELENF